MVRFDKTIGLYDVLVDVDEKLFGCIDENGFFLDPFSSGFHPSEFLRVSPADLRKIAKKAAEVTMRLKK